MPPPEDANCSFRGVASQVHLTGEGRVDLTKSEPFSGEHVVRVRLQGARILAEGPDIVLERPRNLQPVQHGGADAGAFDVTYAARAELRELVIDIVFGGEDGSLAGALPDAGGCEAGCKVAWGRAHRRISLQRDDGGRVQVTGKFPWGESPSSSRLTEATLVGARGILRCRGRADETIEGATLDWRAGDLGTLEVSPLWYDNGVLSLERVANESPPLRPASAAATAVPMHAEVPPQHRPVDPPPQPFPVTVVVGVVAAILAALIVGGGALHWRLRRRATDRRAEAAPAPREPSLADMKGKVDFGIITIREDEFDAVLARFPRLGRVTGQMPYHLRSLPLKGGGAYTLAVVRCVEQGTTASLDAARDLLEDLAPRWLLVVGIAGGVPSEDVSLGDVVVSTRIHDFSVDVVLQDGRAEYALAGGPIHKAAATLAAGLPGLAEELSGWSSPASIGVARPPVHATEGALYGDDAWQARVRRALAAHAGRDAPRVTAGAIASSDRLIKDTEILSIWLKVARQVVAVEMESAGVYRAAHGKQVPTLTIRGISDVIGHRRDGAWTAYACHTAAAFTRALLRTRPIAPVADDLVTAR